MSTNRIFPEFLEKYMEYTENTEPPYLYRLWSGISIIAAALQRKCWLRWDRVLFPNFYIVLVGPSGVRKGTAMYPAQDLLRRIDIHTASEAVTREQLIVELSKATQTDEDPLTGLPTLFSSITVFSKEFTVFLGYNNQQLLMDLTDWFDCDDRWKYATKTSGKFDIKGVWLNIIGGTTPNQLQISLPLDAIGGGLSSRIIFIYEDRKGKKVRYPSGINWTDLDESQVESDLNLNLRESLVDDLMDIKGERGEWRFDRSFQKEFDRWDEESESMTKFSGTFLEPYHTRRTTHILKLCMIMSVNRNGDHTITGDDLIQAANILTETERKMPNTFTGMGRNEDAYALAKIVTILNSSEVTMYSNLLSKIISDVSHERAWAVITSLERMQRLTTESYLDKKTGKEDIKIFYKGDDKK